LNVFIAFLAAVIKEVFVVAPARIVASATAEHLVASLSRSIHGLGPHLE
jgi:hypothetical protein